MKLFIPLLVLVMPLCLAADIVISDVSIYTGPNTDPKPVVLRISEGRITDIGKDIGTGGSSLYSGEGGFVTPGLIDAGTTLGIEEVGLSTRAEDHRYLGDRMSAAFNPMLAFNLNSSLVPSVIEEGVLHVHSRPEPGKDIFAGLGGLASLVTGPADRDMLHVYLGETGRERTGKSRAASLQRLLLALEQAKLFGEKRKAYESGRMKALDFPETDLVVIGRVLQGETGLAIHVDRATEILAVMEALDPFELRVALYGAREAWKVADEIARRNIPVVLNVLDNRPVSFDRLGSRLDQANLLHEAGIVVAFMSEYVYQESRMLTQSAGVAVAHGLPWQTALDAITVNPARIFGVSDRLGSLEPGREATLVIWSGDPLELTSYPTHIMVDGEFIEPANRQKLLRDRYRTLVDEDDRPYVYR